MSTASRSSGVAVRATPTQEALFWIHQRSRDRSVYTLTWRLSCGTAPDRGALRAAWQAVVDRHDALRTSLRARDGVVELDVRPRLRADPRSVEIDDPGSVPADTLLRLVAEEVHQQPIDLAEAPLARLTRVRVGAEHELLLTAHHAVVDGWALQLLLADLGTAYAAAVDGRAPEFAGPAPALLDHAAAAGPQAPPPGLDHWRAALDGAVAGTLRPDRPGRRTTGGPGTVLAYELSPEAAAGVAALAAGTYATPFAVLLAATQVVLARGGAGPEVAVGVVVANRVTPAEQALVGYLANVCVVRGAVGPADTVAAVVERARDRMWETLGHQGVPYPLVHRALPEATRAALGDTPPVLLDFLGPIGTGLRLGDVPLTLHRSPNRSARADVGIAVAVDGDTYRLEVEYATDRYDRGTVLGLLHDLDAVLAADPATAVADLAVGTAAERLPAGPPPAADRPAPAGPPSTSDRPAPAGLPTGTRPGSGGLVERVWTDLLGTPPAGPDEDFYAVGGRSLKAFDLVAALEAATGTRIDLMAFLARPTPRGLAGQLAASTAAGAPASTLVTVRDGPDRHVHLLPGAGGTLADYRELVDALPADWRVTGSQEREPVPTVPAAAARFHADLVAAGPPPDLLVGWSMGGQVGFALAGRYGADPPALAVLDAAPPVGYDPAEVAEPALLESFAALVRGGVDEPPDCSPPRVAGDTDLALRVLAACCAGAAGDPDRAPSAAALADRWSAYRRHATAVAGYVAPGPLPVPALLVAADLTDAELDRWSGLLGPPARRLRLRTDHTGLLRAGAEEVAAALRDWRPADVRRT